jgi:hypothetical protein
MLFAAGPDHNQAAPDPTHRTIRSRKPQIMSNRDNLERQELAALLERLRKEHADLDQEVALASAEPATDQLYLGRMKRRKLQLKDMIMQLRSDVMPDMPA